MDRKELARKLKSPLFFTEYTGTIKGKPFSFDGHEPNKDVYEDESPRIIVVAGRQVAKSETCVRLLLAKAFTNPHFTFTYGAPIDAITNRFQADRFRPAIKDGRHNLLENAVEKGRDLLSATRFRNNTIIYFVSLYGDGDGARGIAGDAVLFDEVQDISQNAIENTIKNTSHSQIYYEEYEMRGQAYFFGTPKEAGSYYQTMWLMSDMKKWHVTCTNPDCCEEQLVTFNHIKQVPDKPDRYRFECHYCGTELDRNKGRWLPTNPEATAGWSGYHYSQLYFPHNTATSIMMDYRTMGADRFANEVLGEFYSGAKKPLTREIIDRNSDFTIPMSFSSEDFTYMGVDWGGGVASKTIVHIIRPTDDDRFEIVYAEEIKEQDFEKKLNYIGQLMNQFRVEKTVVDMGYGAYENDWLYERFGSMVNACRYSNFEREPHKKKRDGKNIIMVDRTFTIDKIVDMFHKERFIIPRLNKTEWEIFIDHYVAIEVEYKVSMNGTGKKIYTHKTPDDALHALTYAYLAWKEANNVFTFDYNERETLEVGDVLDAFGEDDLPSWG